VIHATVLSENPSHEEFLAIRKTKVTGTDVATLLGFNKYNSLYGLVLEKRGLVPPKEETEAMWLGKVSEPHILEAFARRTGHKIRPNRSIFASEQHPFAAATPDGFAADDTFGIEAKLIGLNSAKEYGESGTAEVMTSHFLQVQWYMAVCRLDLWYIVAQAGTRISVHPIERDQALIYRLLEAGQEFYDKYIVGTETPEPGADDVDTVSSLYPFSTDDEIPETDEIRALAMSLAEARLAKSVAITDEKAARARLEALMKDKGKIKGSDFTISWKKSKDSTSIDYEEVVVEAIAKLPSKYSIEIQKMIPKYTKQTPGSRVFRPTGELFKKGED